MNFYERQILPPILNCVCGLPLLNGYREGIVKRARGSVLEIGLGSSLNTKFYAHEQVTEITGIDPNESLLHIAAQNESPHQGKINLIRAVSERLPFENNRFDSAVVTFSLCTIPEPVLALEEIKRVLRPGGDLHFCEHGLSDNPKVQKWQRWLEPLWKPLAGGCHLKRDIFSLIRATGFKLHDHETMYVKNIPKFIGYIYKGSAKKN